MFSCTSMADNVCECSFNAIAQNKDAAENF